MNNVKQYLEQDARAGTDSPMTIMRALELHEKKIYKWC